MLAALLMTQYVLILGPVRPTDRFVGHLRLLGHARGTESD